MKIVTFERKVLLKSRRRNEFKQPDREKKLVSINTIEPIYKSYRYRVTLGGNAHLYDESMLQNQCDMTFSCEKNPREIFIRSTTGKYQILPIISVDVD